MNQPTPSLLLTSQLASTCIFKQTDPETISYHYMHVNQFKPIYSQDNTWYYCHVKCFAKSIFEWNFMWPLENKFLYGPCSDVLAVLCTALPPLMHFSEHFGKQSFFWNWDDFVYFFFYYCINQCMRHLLIGFRYIWRSRTLFSVWFLKWTKNHIDFTCKTSGAGSAL